MVHIYICEDNLQQLGRLKKIIEDYILIMDYDMHLEYATTDPHKLIDYFSKAKTKQSLFFLDIDLNSDISGMSLAYQIKEFDPDVKIVFTTAHAELAYMTFMYKIEAMDYILKFDIEAFTKRIIECIETVNNRSLKQCYEDHSIIIKIGDRKIKIDLEELIYIESSPTPHKLILHLLNRNLELYGQIKEFEVLHCDLMRCHQSFIINMKKVREISGKEIYMSNGEKIYASSRFIKTINKKIMEMK